MCKKIFILSSILILFIACDSNSNEVCTKECKTWKECKVISDEQTCVLKPNKCEEGTCGDNQECDLKIHECKAKENCELECDDWKECKVISGEQTCVLKPNKCEEGTCGDNQECDLKIHECKAKVSCELECKTWQECKIVDEKPSCILKPNRCNDDEDCEKCDPNLHICRSNKCDDGSEVTCKVIFKDCEEGKIPVIKENCYHCVYADSCSSCGDGQAISCDSMKPTCNTNQELAYYNACYACVEPNTCKKECEAVSDCFDKNWEIKGQGHWSCESGACKQVVDNETCGDKVCDKELGETNASCIQDCKKEEVECEKVKDCLIKKWEIKGQGHWSCESGVCKQVVENESCGDNNCDADTGETLTSCRIDCSLNCNDDYICDRTSEDASCEDCECDELSDCMAKNWEGDKQGHWACYYEAGYCVEIADPENCGNKVCDKELGETKQSCEKDCK